MGGTGGGADADWGETGSPTKRERRRATCWNCRSVGRFGAGVLSARG